ncbi:MAG TPA: helix-hairpin-helix domain-containing protein [Ferruginibacter sp.]|nr:helix-hairpin-helix domain-containing protein [Ferruginibacter sp.]
MFKNFAKDYFNFTHKERAGIISIMLLIIFFMILPFIFPYFIKQAKPDIAAFEKDIAALNIKKQLSTKKNTRRNFDENNYQNYYQPSEKNYYTKQNKGVLFYFDPNTLSEEGWVRLGVREKTAATIQKYIAKGGKFYKPADIGKIWGLHENEVARLLPYVRIAAKESAAFVADNNIKPQKTIERYAQKMMTVDINDADTTAFIALPGIGSKLANRIINFRDKLGGFYTIEQVAETFALPDSTFQKIKHNLQLNNTTVKKININAATIDELKLHPYIRYNLANAIVQYRNQHGQFVSVNDLKKIMIFSDEKFNKVEPYLALR